MDPYLLEEPLAVTIGVHAASWRFTRSSPTVPDIITAELYHPSATGSASVTAGDVFVSHRLTASRRRLEEQLGFVLPEQACEALRGSRLTTTTAQGVLSPDAEWIHQRRYQPWRASPVYMGDQPPISYGRLLRDDPPLRTWANGPHSIDIIAIATAKTATGDPVQEVSFRLSYNGRVIIADDIMLQASLALMDDDTIRRVAEYAVFGRPHTMLTEQQRRLLDAYGDDLLDVVAVPFEPYPVGTRVALLDDHGEVRTTGVVVGGVGEPLTESQYHVRPDVAMLPGHPLAQVPDAFLLFPALTARATLRPQDTGTGPTGIPVLGYGARVRTVDDPHIDTGTVLRAIVRENGSLYYDLQPDGSDSHPVRRHEGDIVALAGTAWQSIDALLDARAEAGVPLEVGEVLIGLDSFTMVEASPDGPVPRHPAEPLPALDPMFGLAWRPEPSAGLDGRDDEPYAGAPYLEAGDDVIVHDPVHGFLTVAPTTFEAALRLDAETLTRLINEVPGIEVAGIEPMATLAALAATHRQDALATPTHDIADLSGDGPAADVLPPEGPTAAFPELEPPF